MKQENGQLSKAFTLHERLAADTHPMMIDRDVDIRLMDNALWPWFILVPHTDETEFHRLPAPLHRQLTACMLTVSRFIEARFNPDKINVASIGNIVSQLHVHVLGRWRDDPAWPGVVWGFPQKTTRTVEEVETLRAALGEFLKNESRDSHRPDRESPDL